MKSIKSKQLSNTCRVQLLDCTNPNNMGARFRVAVIYDSMLYSHTDWPILYPHSENIGWDFPERIPVYTREHKVVKEFLEEAKRMNERTRGNIS